MWQPLDALLSWTNHRRQSRNEVRLLRDIVRLECRLTDQKARLEAENEAIRKENKILAADNEVARKEVELMAAGMERIRARYQADIATDALREATGGRSAVKKQGVPDVL